MNRYFQGSHVSLFLKIRFPVNVDSLIKDLLRFILGKRQPKKKILSFLLLDLMSRTQFSVIDFRRFKTVL